MGAALPKYELYAVIQDAMEPMVHGIDAATTARGLRYSYVFITKNNAKYVKDSNVVVLAGFKDDAGMAGELDENGIPMYKLLWMEFGTRQRIKKDGSSTGFMKPNPFIRTLIDSHKARIKSEVQKSVSEMVLHEAKINKLI